MKRFLVSILITIGIIVFLLTQISLRDLYALLKSIEPFWAIVGIIGYLLANLFRAIRFQRLIHSKDIPLSELFKISVLYHLSLMVLPSKFGELSYPYLLNRFSGMTITEGMASLIASRVYDFFMILMIFLFASFGFQSFFQVSPFLILILSALLIVLILLVFFYMSHLLKLLSTLIGNVSSWTGSKGGKPLQWTQRKIHEIAEDFYAIKARRTYVSVTLTSLASWGGIFWTFYAFLKGFGVDLSFFKLVFGSTVAVIANALPISGIGNWGTLEAGWTAGFLMVGLPKGTAITTGFGVHIMIFLICAVLGLICWVSLNLPKRKQLSPSPTPDGMKIR